MWFFIKYIETNTGKIAQLFLMELYKASLKTNYFLSCGGEIKVEATQKKIVFRDPHQYFFDKTVRGARHPTQTKFNLPIEKPYIGHGSIRVI